VIDLTRCEPSYRCFFSSDSHSHFDVSSDLVKMKSQLDTIHEGYFEQYLDFLMCSQLNFQIGFPLFIQKDLSWKNLIEIDRLQEYFTLVMRSGNPLNAQSNVLQKYFPNDHRMHALLSFQNLYVGLNPDSSPSVLTLLHALEISEGVWYPVGGFKKIVDALESKCIELGVEIRLNAQVDEILVSSSSRFFGHSSCYGVRINGNQSESIKSKAVVVNADYTYACEHLLSKSKRNHNTKSAKHSSSVAAFYFALNKKLSALPAHSIFFGTDTKSSWKGIYEDQLELPLQENANFYVHAPSRCDESACPLNHDALMVLVPCGTLNQAQDAQIENEVSLDCATENRLDHLRESARNLVIQRFDQLGITDDFRSCIVAEDYFGPLQWRQQLNLSRGAVFGLAHNLFQLAVFRPAHKSATIKNLFFVGASSRPGNGVPLVMLGAKHCADAVLEEYKMDDS